MTSSIAIRSKVSAATVGERGVYSTTPGGTARISYSRDELLSLAASPLSRSPPAVILPAAIARHSPQQQPQPQAQTSDTSLEFPAPTDELDFHLDL